jgi:hypothetical protein
MVQSLSIELSITIGAGGVGGVAGYGVGVSGRVGVGGAGVGRIGAGGIGVDRAGGATIGGPGASGDGFRASDSGILPGLGTSG